jgi:hypothetical protein
MCGWITVGNGTIGGAGDYPFAQDNYATYGHFSAQRGRPRLVESQIHVFLV